jgi:hypothetical protein
VDELVSDLETLTNPTVGLAAHPGQVDIRITAKARTRDEALVLIQPVEEKVRNLLGDQMYGIDDIRISDTVDELITRLDLIPVIIYDQVHQELAQLISEQLRTEVKIYEASGNPNGHTSTPDLHEQSDALILNLRSQGEGEYKVDLQGEISNNTLERTLRFGGHPSMYMQWAANQILGFMREMMIKEIGAT